MNGRPPQNLPLDQFLVAINACDLDGSWVVPSDDVAERLTREVEQRAGIKSRNLAGEDNLEEFKHWVSAKPGDFISQTRVGVDGICALLTQKGAESFELLFHNIKQAPNAWGDKVLLAVRYSCGTQAGA